MATVPAIGIDLGTTFSCVSVYRRGRPEVIPNSVGERLIPSIVYFHPTSGNAYVGKVANKMLTQCPKNGLLDAKRFIGRKFDDEFISRYINSNKTPFTLARGEDDQAVFEIEVNEQKIMKKPEEVSAEVLKHLKRTASDYVGQDVTKAVISVPAYFSNAQRKATMKAAELAGFTVLKLITEPTAAAIHYVSDRNRNNSNIIAFDFGGGTLDASLIKVNNNEFEVKAVYGDTLLGGRNFDEILFEHFDKEIADVATTSFASRKLKRRISEMCTELKELLSTNQEFTLYLDSFDGNSDLSMSMTRENFEQICKHLLDNMMDVVELCLHDSGLSKSDINEVILVGGTTRIPKVQELLSSYFGIEKIKTDLNPDEAVAAGASIHAAFLLGDNQDLEKYKVTEVTPMSLGISETGNLMSFFIHKNSPLPARVTKEFQTSFNDQSDIVFQLYEGERTNSDLNNKLGEFHITNLPKKRAGDVDFRVNLNLDEDGILSVEATEKSTGKNNKLTVTLGQFRLSEKKIKATLADAKKHKVEDRVFEEFVRTKRRMQKQCRHVLYDIRKISLEVDQDIVRKCCNDFLSTSDGLDYTDIEKLNAKFAIYNNSVLDILQKNCLLSLL